MTPSPDPESISWFRFILATTTVVGLMGLLAWGLKRFAKNGWNVSLPGMPRRLKLVESLPLDARRRLAIVQCDDVQHLLLLGMQQDIVIANNLKPTPSSSSIELSTATGP